MRSLTHGTTCVLMLLALASAVSRADDSLAPAVPEGYTLIHGDILVRAESLDKAGSIEPSQWPSGIVHYDFAASVSALDQATVRAAMDTLEAISTLDFRLRSGEDDYVEIRSSTANNSQVGMVGGRQILNLQPPFIWGTTLHELLHAVGFHHEQSRSDRDTYVDIQWPNISLFDCSGSCYGNFVIAAGAFTRGPYDFGSIMHYSATDFGYSGATTIAVNQPWTAQWQNAIGQRIGLSDLDSANVGYLYPPNGVRFLQTRFYDPAGASGSILHPFSTMDQMADFMPDGGTLYVLEDEVDVTGVIDTPMTVRAAYDTVVFGDGQ